MTASCIHYFIGALLVLFLDQMCASMLILEEQSLHLKCTLKEQKSSFEIFW